ncbi:hypothetical protein [Pelagibius marinus]|uniref:hypothetical protein n=1 Tax=Pelagibius marinus TaxID=2762760 RepID=UPI00187220AC|nr:hypothetical protein [Pelagibius marinus]
MNNPPSGLRRPLLALLLLLSAALGTSGPAAAAPLEDDLLAFEGRFQWQDARRDYVFSDRPGLAGLLEPITEDKLSALAGCIDDPRLAAARLDGKAVTLGVMCYQALRLFAYVERENWPGHIGPLATPEERRAAKQAWRTALAEHRYVLH